MLLSPDRGMQQIGCEVDRFRFSGHAHRRELTALAAELQPKTIILVHRETEGGRWPKNNLREHCPKACVLTPSQGERITV